EFCAKRRKLIAGVVEDAFKTLWEGSTSQSSGGIVDLISDGESKVAEFKSTARWNLHTQAHDPKLEAAIAKTICGFMNAEGGTLLIGVADDGAVVGIENDYSTLGKPNRDGFELFLTQLVDNQISGPAATL